MFLSKKQQQDEITKMKAELMDACSERLNESSIKLLKEYSETVMDALRNGVTLQHSYTEWAMEKMDRETDVSIQEIRHISSMSDEEVKRVYYATFKRRRPISG
ncbi:hypothetical protein IKT18_01485 [Candidatus Saccharibacteria bacterium]|nr:hypothetical protein [Candidatus Saccharibacteria bacterium]